MEHCGGETTIETTIETTKTTIFWDRRLLSLPPPEETTMPSLSPSGRGRRGERENDFDQRRDNYIKRLKTAVCG
jgi:hypothetical protein